MSATRSRCRALLVGAALSLSAVAIGSSATAQSGVAFTPQTYADEGRWLCLPTRLDACSADPRIAELSADGKRTPLAWPAAADGDTDCFYVYPTVNRSPVPSNPDPYAGNQAPIRKVAAEQIASLRRTCRIYAPLYRQATIGAYALPEDVRQRFIGVAAGDVLAAFDRYIAEYNNGRRIVLVGHSQGAEMLIRLIQARFDGDAGLRGRLSIAVLAGIPLHVPVGAAIGGEFSQTPICTEALQRGCVVSFASFADGADPKDDSRIPTPAGQERVCVNPAALDRPGRSSEQRRTDRVTLKGTLVPANRDGDTLTLIRRVYSGACVQGSNTRFYSIRDETPSGDARHQVISTRPGPLDPVTSLVVGDIGLHVSDMQFPAHDLIALVEARAGRD